MLHEKLPNKKVSPRLRILMVLATLGFLFPLVLQAQQTIINGTVKDSQTGEPLIGANILIKGTTTGTTSNLDGTYRIDGVPANADLVFSYIGYTTQTVNISNRSKIDVELVPDLQQLSEVVVIGYGTQEKKDITGSVVAVKSKELENRRSEHPHPRNQLDQRRQ